MGFPYGTLVVNKVYRPITVTNAIVGINGKKINLNDRVDGAGEVTVQVTVAEDDNYLETTKEFTAYGRRKTERTGKKHLEKLRPDPPTAIRQL